MKGIVVHYQGKVRRALEGRINERRLEVRVANPVSRQIGYWESKDIKDDIDKEIQLKIDKTVSVKTWRLRISGDYESNAGLRHVTRRKISD